MYIHIPYERHNLLLKLYCDSKNCVTFKDLKIILQIYKIACHLQEPHI